jgi:serine/threonine protein kinase
MNGAYGEYTIVCARTAGEKQQSLIRDHYEHLDYIETNAIRELLFYRTVRHPNLMSAEQCRVSVQRVAIRMPAAHVDLSTWLRRSRSRRARLHHGHTIMRDVARALEFMHENGMAHGDLKPSNVVLDFHDKQAHARLIDFGTVQWQAEMDGAMRYRRAMTTFWYVAPEDVVHDIQGPAADIWAFGLIMLSYWTGWTPLRFDSYEEARRWYRANPIPINLDLVKKLPGRILALIRRMLDPQPQTRATAAEVLSALDSTPVPGTIREISRSHTELAALLAAGTRGRAVDIECANQIARAVFDPWYEFFVSDIAREVEATPRTIRSAITSIVRNLP